ncbi:uncharacterized protein LOC124540767 [Vanessa cardui]|uniref:uncharacterized protein LOC124540767 n=1 Tax=Vanessa cardui TaxID=171605 RepID=UPI001F13D9FA|nr:uncharacterized protein LOC124540767 [Vanessa cardui]
MSVIAVGGVPMKYNLVRVIKLVAPAIKGHFEGLNFAPGSKNTKICYLRLSEKLDPLQVVENINSKPIGTTKIKAFIPDHVPDLPLASKLKQIPQKLRKSLRIPPELTPRQLIVTTHGLIMQEMQAKYTGLYKLSAKTGKKGNHELLNTIGQVVFDRLNEIMKSGPPIDSCFKLSNSYRKKHPHFGDFQFILSTLHQLQDAEGKPREQIQENELTVIPVERYNIDSILATCNKYNDKIISKILDHVNNLKTEVNPDNDSAEEAARVKVREQLKKLTPYLPNIIRHTVNKYFVPHQTSNVLVWVYGEPYLPKKEVMAPWASRLRAHSARDQRMYNMLVLRAPRHALPALLAADGTLIGGSKLVIRPSDLPMLKVRVGSFGTQAGAPNESMNEAMDVDADFTEEWNEQW